MFYFKAPKPKFSKWTKAIFESYHYWFSELSVNAYAFFKQQCCSVPLLYDFNYDGKTPLTGKGIIETYDGASLETQVTIKQKDATIPVPCLKFVVNFNFRVNDNTRVVNDAIVSGISQVQFKFRQNATSYYDHLIDGIAIVQWLVAQGVPFENIQIHGHGAARHIAALVVAHYHEVYKPSGVNLSMWSEFSPGNINTAEQVRHFRLSHASLKSIDDIGSAWHIPGADAYQTIIPDRKFLGSAPDLERLVKLRRGKELGQSLIKRSKTYHFSLDRLAQDENIENKAI